MKEALYSKFYQPGIRILGYGVDHSNQHKVRSILSSLYESLLFWPGIHDSLAVARDKNQRDVNEPWAVNIEPEIEAIPIETLIDLWHLRFPEAPRPEEVIKAGKFYYEASRRLWRDKQLHKEEHTDGETVFVVETVEKACK